MRTINPSELDELLQRKPILMLDITGLTIDFLGSIVRQSPGFITTKKGNKTLPLELWLEILEWTELWHMYSLVQPQGLEDGSINTLICAKIPERYLCGQLQDPEAITDYEYYLDQPGDIPDDDWPFSLPQPLNGDPTYKVPITAIGQEDMLLCGDLTVPDIIAWVEAGECCLCGGQREFCVGCRDGREVKDIFFPGMRLLGDCGNNLSCPLCMGLTYSLENLFQQDHENEDEPGYLTGEEYCTWVSSRWIELNYRQARY